MKNMELVIDGTDEAGLFAGDGKSPPFVVFDVKKQENIAGPFDTREEAERNRADILAGKPATLDANALGVALEALDSSEDRHHREGNEGA